ncbi:aldehyde dehydrogenase family protein [Nonomuraea jabiensis]|uniref:aldehyde dehydrogenase family protein n=1 Tax=Nonomuraea jabiensis TaxID=882448 RepID=UPI0036908506
MPATRGEDLLLLQESVGAEMVQHHRGELGGSNPVIVDQGVDLMAAAQAIAEGAFGCAGQNCLSVQRVYVVAQHYDELLGHLTHTTTRLSVGSKHDETTDVGPLIDAAAARRVAHRVEEAVARGAVVRAGAVRQDATYQPTILIDLAPDDPIVTEEIFGPVVSVLPVADLDDAVHQANRAATGLQAGVFTRDTTAALRTARRPAGRAHPSRLISPTRWERLVGGS